MTSSLDIADQAAAMRAELVGRLVDEGLLTDEAWRAAFEEVPAHAFVPAFYDYSGHRIAEDDPATRGQWLSEVYSDRPLVTHRTDGAATSSRSEPSLMAGMLDALQVEPGMKILEIGTGTGYNAALMSHRLGSDNVTTIDVVAELTEAARERLADVGYQPVVDTGNGALGCPLYAPYHRIIATCRVDTIPVPWVRQLTDDGFILAPISGALARVRRTGRESAEGRFGRRRVLHAASQRASRRSPAQGAGVPEEPRPRVDVAARHAGEQRLPVPDWGRRARTGVAIRLRRRTPDHRGARVGR